MKWRYRWTALLIPLLAACASLIPVTSTAVVPPTAPDLIRPTATATAITLQTPTVVPTVKPTSSFTRIVDPSVPDFVSQLSDLGVQTRLTGRAPWHSCLITADRSEFYRYIAGIGVKWGYGEEFDLRPFGDEESAIAFVSGIRLRNCSSYHWADEFPYFRCGSVTVFLESSDQDLQNNFEELCGRPIGHTSAYSRNFDLFVPSE